jgi:hypothetical protein
MMIRVAAALCFLSLFAVSPGTAQTTASDSTTTAQPQTPDSTSATQPQAPDTSTVSPPAAAPSATSAEPVTVTLKDGTQRHYVRVERSGSYVNAYRLDGGSDNIRAHDIARITGDVTADVLNQGKTYGRSPDTESAGSKLFRGRPLPDMKFFPLAQAGLLVRVNGVSENPAWCDVGVMVNVSPKIALGGTLGLVSDFSYTRFVIKPRLRTWLGKGFALDVAPGIFFPSGGSVHGSTGFTGEVALVKSDWVSLTYMVEAINSQTQYYYAYGPYPLYTTSETEVSHFIGVKAGGGIGLAGAAVMILGLIADAE